MKKITKKYLLVVAFVFLLLPILKVSADDASSNDASSTPSITTTTTFNLIYSTDSNGTLTGSSTQTVDQGSNGTPVTAIPNYGFQFLNWSDNSTSTTRTDIDIQNNLNITAYFASTTDSTGSSSNANSTDISTSTLSTEIRVNVPPTCRVKDINNNTYDFPATDSPAGYLGICAIESAKESNLISDFQLSYYSGFGLFVSSINGVTANPSNQYWALYLNNNFANCGIGCLPVASDDEIEFQLHDFLDNDLGNHFIIDIGTLPSPSTTTSTNPTGGSGGGSNINHQAPDLKKMLSFLDANQSAIFGSEYYIDWAAIAYGSEPSYNSSTKNQIINSLQNNLFSDSSITDYERHSMAMMALGLNPYTKTNYIQKIIDSWNSKATNIDNVDSGDIFGVITLMSSGYTTNDDIIKKMEYSIISKQFPDGSWGNIDLTGAAIQALSLVQNVPGASSAITKGLNFLRSAQKSDGGFGNPDSTSWAIQGLIAGNSDPKQLMNNGNSPLDYLTANQMVDGSIGTTTDNLDTRVWATEWAIPATALITWPEILHDVSKPVELSGSGSSSVGASTTFVIATTTSTSTVIGVLNVQDVVNGSSTPIITPTTIRTNITATTSPKNQKITESKATQPDNSNLLAGAQSFGFIFNTHNTLMILGSILAGIGLFSIILI